MVSPVLKLSSIAKVFQDLSVAHAFLVDAARRSIPRLGQLATSQWGVTAKRVAVSLPAERPELVPDAIDNLPFSEVVNQCATLERLLGALHWADKNLDGYAVERCHPTTSSQKSGGQADNDLMLFREADGHRCRFEVSDVASSTGDGNGKELKDLASLGIPPTGDGQVPWSDRRFLVVSSEFSKYLLRPTRHGLKAGWFHYALVGEDFSTHVIEVRPGVPVDGP
jgi:hypothetical protein